MSHLWTRLEKLEAKAPAPFESHVFLRIVVDPNPNGGPPVRVGVAQRWTSLPYRDSILETFEPFCPEELLPPELTPTQVRQVLEHVDVCALTQTVQVRRRPDGSGTIVLLESGKPEREMMELLCD
jgi:hypothetical protein